MFHGFKLVGIIQQILEDEFTTDRCIKRKHDKNNNSKN